MFTALRNGDVVGWSKVLAVTVSADNFSRNLFCPEMLLLLLGMWCCTIEEGVKLRNEVCCTE